jgi:N-methylhydantoinase B/oxoprolinase/acetone carboxylase alpha subunit
MRGEIFGYLANIAHHVDVGGGAPGSIGVSNEIYQEGVVIPPIRFVKEGQTDPDIFALIRANFRGTKEISGDFRAQTAANRLGWQRLQALVAMQLKGLLFKPLSSALPDRVLAGTKGCICNVAFGGINPATRDYFTFYETIAGGYGATRRNDSTSKLSDGDGWHECLLSRPNDRHHRSL